MMIKEYIDILIPDGECDISSLREELRETVKAANVGETINSIGRPYTLTPYYKIYRVSDDKVIVQGKTRTCPNP